MLRKWFLFAPLLLLLGGGLGCSGGKSDVPRIRDDKASDRVAPKRLPPPTAGGGNKGDRNQGAAGSE